MFTTLTRSKITDMNQKKPTASIGSSLDEFLIEQGIVNDVNYVAIQRVLNLQAATKSEITSDEEYEQALALMDKLVDDDDNQSVLIERLSKFIGQWENTNDGFAAFNQRIDADPE